MQNTSKGYILPMVLIIILLGLAGFFLFAQPIKAPVVTDEIVPAVPQTPAVVPEEEIDAVGEDSESEDAATTTASTTLELEADL